MKGMMSDLVDQSKMNHIEYNGFNTVQDQADNHTEGHYIQLQAKVADRVMRASESICLGNQTLNCFR